VFFERGRTCITPPVVEDRPSRGEYAPVDSVSGVSRGSRPWLVRLQVCLVREVQVLFKARALRPVTESNCVLARGGGKQLEVNDQSVTQVNSIRPQHAASLLANGEARTGETRKSTTLRGSVLKRSWSEMGDWRRNGRKARHMKQRDLGGDKVGVHARRAEEPVAQESEHP
jgi:hypothetical protein